MERSPGSRSRHWLVLTAVAAVAALGACSEDIEGGAACPVLCAQQNVAVFDTLLEPVVLDTSIAGYPLHGTESVLLLASRGDTLDTRPVVRFDSLFRFFNVAGVDSQIEHIDSVYVKLRIDKVRSKVTAPVTIDVFDVDTIVGDTILARQDTSTAVERTLFRSDRLIGTATLDTNEVGDSIFINLDSAAVEAKVVNQQRLRLGFRITSTQRAELHVVSLEGGDPPLVRYDPSADTAIKHLTVVPRSGTPQAQPVIASDLADYVHVFRAPAAPGGPVLALGGLPGRRVLMRFEIPSHIIDSSNVLRATLFLTQSPVRGIDDSVAFTVFPQLVTAGQEVTDVGRAMILLNPPGTGFDSVSIVPRDSGLRVIEIVNALRAWSLPVAARAQRALVLRAALEGSDPRMAAYFSREAPAGLRPSLRVSYSPVRNFGIP
jgi:hypothetical protein